jgi:hypothetical protein
MVAAGKTVCQGSGDRAGLSGKTIEITLLIPKTSGIMAPFRRGDREAEGAPLLRE